MEKIWGIYLNNLHYKHVEAIYQQEFPEGSSRNKVDRINEIITLAEMPVHPYLDQYLFGGRVSVHWSRLKDSESNGLGSISQRLSEPPLGCLDHPREPDLADDIEIVHAFERKDRLYITLGTGTFKSQLAISDYQLQRTRSEYFPIVILSFDGSPSMEIHSDSRLILKIRNALREQIGIDVQDDLQLSTIETNAFLDFKGLLHNARLRKYKGRSVDDSDITEIFEYTARQHVDYANETSFQQMIEDLEDESLSLVFTYDGNDYTIRVGLLTGSVYFQSYTPEEAVEYVFDAYKTTFWGDK